MRESTELKARRYLGEGRLVITRVDGDEVQATCRGTGAVHRCGHDLARGWWCSCPARRTCSHLVALMTVTVQHQDAQ